MVMKYILRHIPRAPVRSLLSLLLAAALAASLGQFIAIVRSNRALVDEMYDTAEIHAGPVNRSGLVDVNIPYEAIDVLLDADFAGWYYFEAEGPCYWVDDRGNDIFSPCSVYSTTDVDIFGTMKGLTYAPGDDAGVFAGSEERVCFVSKAVFEREGMELGDDIHLCGGARDERERYAEWHNDDSILRGIGFTVIGTFEEGPGDYDILAPWQTMKLLYGRFYLSMPDGSGVVKIKADFRVRNDLLRDEYAYRERPNEMLANSDMENVSMLSLRVLDGEVQDVIKPLEENTDLLELLLPFVGAAVVVIGAVIPGLVILQSSKEAAIMRALGTGRSSVVAMLACEQMLLTFAGLALGVFVLIAAHGSADEALVNISGAYGYFAAYALLSTAVCAAASAFVSAGSALKLLQSKE